MNSSPPALLSRALALVVVVASLVAVPALTTPASADGVHWNGTLKVGETITAKPGRLFSVTDVWENPGCESGYVNINPGNSSTSVTIVPLAGSRYLRILTYPAGGGPLVAECVGPVDPNITYTGTLKAGETLTATQGRVISQVTGYSDKVCDLPTETGAFVGNATYSISPNFAGQYVRVTTTLQGGGSSVTGPCVGPVAAATFDSFTGVTYTGDRTAGGTLTAQRPSVPQGAQVTYAWKVTTKSGTTTRSTTSTFTSTLDDAGAGVQLEVTASSVGYQTKTLSSEPAKIEPRAFDDEAVAGLTLVDSTPDSPLRPGDTLSLGGRDGAFPQGTDIAVRIGLPNSLQPENCDVFESALSSYQVSGDEVGKQLCAVVTVTATGYAERQVTLFSDKVVGVFSDAEAGFDVAPQVGVESTVELDGLDPEADALAYAWTIDDEVVSETSVYTPVPADAGKTVEVEVTATKDGYDHRVFTASATVADGVLPDPRALVQGTPQVGERLSAAVEADASLEGATYEYLWGAQLPGETTCESIGVLSRSLVLPGSARGARLCVSVTIDAPGYESVTVTSDLTEPVVGQDLPVWLPKVDDTTPTFGDTLTASVVKRDLPKGAKVRYQWGRQGERVCEPLVGAKGATYTVGVDDVGERLCVISTVSAFGYEDGSASSRPTAEVAPASMGTVTATLDDTTPTVGDTITASWSGDGVPEGAEASYEFRAVDGDTCSTPDIILLGKVLDSSSATREVGPADVGLRLCAVVTLSEPGYADAVATTDLTEEVAKAVFEGGSVAFDGTPTVDAAVELDVTDPTPAPESTTTTYAVDDVPVEAGDDGSYTPTAADAGKELTVTVVFSRDGYEDETVTDTETIAKATFTGGTVALDSRPAVGQRVTVTTTEPTPEAGKPTFVWTVGNKVVSMSDGYRPLPADRGKKLVVTATWTRDGYEDLVVSSTAVGVAAAPKRISVDRTTVVTGESFVVTATGLAPHQAAQVRLAGVLVWKGNADRYGTVERSVAFAPSTEPGPGRSVRVSGFDTVSPTGVFSGLSYSLATEVTLKAAPQLR